MSTGSKMDELKNLLRTAVADVTFDAGHTEWLGHRAISTSYASRPEEIVTAEQLREMAGTGEWNAREHFRALKAILRIDRGLLAQIEVQLRSLLQDYIDPETDQIGHTFPTGGLHESSFTWVDQNQRTTVWLSTIDSFAESTIKSAAILGPETVVNQFSAWLEGETVKYRTASVLNGIALSDSLSPTSGVHLEALPLSVDELPVHLPTLLTRAEDFLGRTVLYIDHEASPALLRPPGRGSRKTVAGGAQVTINFDTVCQALSLESNTNVEVGPYWNHYIGPTGLVNSYGGSRWSSGRQTFETWPHTLSGSLVDRLSEEVGTLYPDGGTGPMLSEEQLSKTLKSVMSLDSDDTLRIAITRWMRSKDDGAGLVDRFIDLRIALEALYVNQIRLSNNHGEIGLRLSLCGAWHLGKDSEDRRNIRKNLNNAYGKSSRAVHTGSISGDGKTLLLLSEGQDLCRRGIRKILREGPPEDWMALILGDEDTS